MTRLHWFACLFAVSALALTFTANAAGDPAVGRVKVYTCGGCHGVPGYKNAYPNYHVPRIMGQNRDYLIVALKEYRNGERDHPTMRAQGESLSDQDIEDIAAFLSSSNAK